MRHLNFKFSSLLCTHVYFGGTCKTKRSVPLTNIILYDDETMHESVFDIITYKFAKLSEH